MKLDFKGETAETERDQAVFAAQAGRHTTLFRIQPVVYKHIPVTKSELRHRRPAAAVLELGGLRGWLGRYRIRGMHNGKSDHQ